MSGIIFPSGSRKASVLAQFEDVAEENKESVVEGSAFESIKDVPGIKEKADKLLQDIKENVQEVAKEVEEKVQEVAKEVEEKVEEVAQSVKEEKTEQKEEKKEEPKEEKKEEVKEEPKEEKKEEVKEVEISEECPKCEKCGKPLDEKTVDEVEISLDDNGAVVDDTKTKENPVTEVEVDVGEEVGPDDIVKKSKETCGCSAKSEAQFVRVANLSPKNKTSLREYWLALGFPKDYVDAMVKDY